MTIASLLADLEAAGLAGNAAAALDASLAKINAGLAYIDVGTLDVPDQHGVPRPMWVLTGPVATRAGGRSHYVAHLPMCESIPCRQRKLCLVRHQDYRKRNECDTAGKRKYGRDWGHCMAYHADDAAWVAREADKTYRAKPPKLAALPRRVSRSALSGAYWRRFDVDPMTEPSSRSDDWWAEYRAAEAAAFAQLREATK